MKSKNKYSLPVQMNEKVRMTYDESPAHKGYLKNSVDFVMPKGTPVLAALSGIVNDIKQDSDVGGVEESYDQYGNYIEIAHNNGEFSIYEHIQKDCVKVKVGDHVKEGQVIAKCGYTGWMAHLGPHLHFNVHKYKKNSKTQYESLVIVWKDERYNSGRIKFNNLY
ncbi:MAG: M23 family metallopeptidase [Candidatus Moranbacteria bacterium]|nr:M23 family metallopeptidase [Candidatus Moranbacteria bacterium]